MLSPPFLSTMRRSPFTTRCQASAWVKRSFTLKDALLQQRHRGLQIALIRQRAEVGGKKARHVAPRGKNLSGVRPGEYALVEAGLADGFCVGVVALHRAAAKFFCQLPARGPTRHRQRGRGHAERG